MRICESLGCVLLLGLVLVQEAAGKTLVTQGNLRWVYRNTPLGRQPLAFRSITPSLLSLNGMLYEKDRFGTVRPLFLNRKSGALVNAVEPGTRMAVAKLYSGARKRMAGEFASIVDRFLDNMGLVASRPTERPVLSREPGEPVSESESRPRGLFEDKAGKHGNGNVTSRTAGKRRPVSGRRLTTPASVCSDLNHAVCRSDPQAANEARVVESYKQGVIRSFASRNRLKSGFLGRLFSGIATNPLQFAGAYRAFTGFLAGKIPGVDSAIASAKAAFITSIDKQPLSPAAKAAMKAKVQSVQIRLTPNLTNGQALAGFVQNCGADGMAPGAFAVPPLNEVVVCPGLALEAAVRGGSLAGHLTHVLAHEVGHHCGCDVDPFGRPGPFFSQYTKLRACYQSTFKTSPLMAGEIAADFWGVESLVQRIQGKSKAEAFQFIKNAMRPLCGSPDDGIHPSGRFRINITVGRHPEVRKALGCSAPSLDSPACLLEGRVPQPRTVLAEER